MIEILMFIAIAVFIIAFSLVAIIGDIAVTIIFAALAAIFGKK